MNPRLRAYLEKLGLEAGADSKRCIAFFQGLRGNQLQIANLLNYDQSDTEANQRADLAIRAFGFNPEQPWEELSPETPAQRSAEASTALLPVATTIAPESSNADTSRNAAGPAGIQAAGSDGASTDDHARALNEGREQERARVVAIRELGDLVDASQEQVATAIAGGQSVDQVRAAWHAEMRGGQDGVTPQLGGPSIHSRNSVTGFTRNALVAAMMHRWGTMDDPARHFRSLNERTGMFSRGMESPTDEIHRAVDEGYELSGLPMVEIARRCLELDGVRNVIATPESIIAATRTAMSTSTLVAVFTQASGAIMMDSYERAIDETREFTDVGNNPNFFEREHGRMGKMGALTKHAKGGVADDLEIKDSKATTKIDRYSGRFAFDEMDLINDTFGELSDHTLTEMGESAKSLRPDLVFALLLSNPTLGDGVALFHANHGNLAAGGLTDAGIKDAVAKFALQTENGVTINLRGRHIIVPSTKIVTAHEEIESTRKVAAGGGTNTTYGDMNGVSRLGLNIVESTRIDTGVVDPDTNTAIAGDSSKTFMATDRGKGGIKVTYRRGAPQGPQVSSGMLPAGGGQWGVQMDVKMDIGADAIDHRGLVRID